MLYTRISRLLAHLGGGHADGTWDSRPRRYLKPDLVDDFAMKEFSQQQSEAKHNWLEVYLAGTSWVPVDPTWGRFKDKRDHYFAGADSQQIIVTTGHPALLAKFIPVFHFGEYRYWYSGEKPKLSAGFRWQIRKAGY